MPEKILIVDDEKAIAQLTAMWVERAGYASVLAYDGQSALATAEKCDPDLILLDIRMPDIDGFEVNRRLKAARSALADVPVIFLSAHAQESARQEATAGGSSFFLSKPCERKDLLEATKIAISNRAARRLAANAAS